MLMNEGEQALFGEQKIIGIVTLWTITPQAKDY